MSMTLRPFTPDDYPAVVAVHNAAFPEYRTTESDLRHEDATRDPRIQFGRWVADAGGGIVASGSHGQSPWTYHPRRFEILVTVHPEHERRGIGSALYEHLVAEVARFDPIALRSQTREDMTSGVRFLEKRGFTEEMRERESRLDVAAFDPARFAGAGERARAAGVTICTLRELESDPDRDRKLHELETDLLRDVPHADEPTPLSLERYRTVVLQSPNLLPDAFFVAVAPGGDYVGSSALWKRPADDHLDTGLTGVRPAWRRKGIALALKLRAVAYAQAVGAPVIRTENEVGNRGMLSINEQLGFVPQPAWVFYGKTLKEEA